MRSAASHVYNPLRRGVLDIVSPVGAVFAHGFDYGSVQTQNEHLEQTLGQLKQQQLEQPFERRQLQDLQGLEDLSFVQNDPLVLAESTDENLSGFAATITVDKGSVDGVDVGYAVVGHAGLVGQVVSLSPHTCVVQLITDSESKIGVAFGSSEQYGAVVEGQGTESPLAANYVPPTESVHKGEVMSTSQLQPAQLPPGIPVGTIKSFHTPQGASEQTITLEPTANLQTMMYAAIVQWTPSTSVG